MSIRTATVCVASEWSLVSSAQDILCTWASPLYTIPTPQNIKTKKMLCNGKDVETPEQRDKYLALSGVSSLL